MGLSWKEQVCGYLHDASEDTPHSVEEVLCLLEQEAKECLKRADKVDLSTALHLLNHHNASDRESYIQAIGKHHLARAVKLNDLCHNMDITRLPEPSPKDYQRLARYRKEYDYLVALSK